MKFIFALTAFAALSIATPIPKDGNGQGQQCTTPAASTASATQAATEPNTSATGSKGAGASGPVNPDLVPQFGVTAGQSKSGGTCAGTNNVRIPCNCPPDRSQFISKLDQFVQAGNAFGTATPFPEDNSKQSQITRLQTSIVALQNFDGQPGKGCPAASTTFLAQKSALTG